MHTECTSEKIVKIGQRYGKDMDKTLWLTFLGHPVYNVNGSIKGCLMTCIHSVTRSRLQQTDARPDGRHGMRALPQIIKDRVIDSVTPFHIYVYVYLLIMQQVQDFVKLPISYSGGICPGASCCPIMIVVSGKSKVPKNAPGYNACEQLMHPVTCYCDSQSSCVMISTVCANNRSNSVTPKRSQVITRKLCYSKDDRAMRAI